jgi:hypothetical protein
MNTPGITNFFNQFKPTPPLTADLKICILIIGFLFFVINLLILILFVLSVLAIFYPSLAMQWGIVTTTALCHNIITNNLGMGDEIGVQIFGLIFAAFSGWWLKYITLESFKEFYKRTKKNRQ